MLRNYLSTLVRNLVRNRVYAVLNISGLAIAFTAAFLIGLFVLDELAFDTWVPGHENVYRLAKHVHPPGGGADLLTDGSGPAEMEWFRDNLSDVVAGVRLWPVERAIRHGATEAIEAVVWADTGLFDVFPFPVFEGEPEGAFSQPDSVVLSRSMARKYFGTDRGVIGQTLELDRAHVLRVSTVIEDLPSRSHLKLDIIATSRATFSPFPAIGTEEQGIAFGPVLTYLRLRPGAVDRVRAAAPALLDRHVEPFDLSAGGAPVKVSAIMTYEFQPLAEIHLISKVGRSAQMHFGVLRSSGDRGMITALLLTGALLLLVAIANFANLMTARAPCRAVEIGVRKTAGARRSDLIVQFLGESFFYVAIAFVGALLAVSALLPALNGRLDRTISLSDAGGLMSLSVAALFLFTGMLGGLYPAFVLSRLKPVTVLRSNEPHFLGGAALHELMVIMQFAVLIGLVVATLTIGRQTAFATASAFRSDADQLLHIGPGCAEAFKTRVLAVPGVRGAACAMTALFGGNGPIGLTNRPDGSRFNLHYIGIESGTLELYGLAPVAGRFMRPEENVRRQDNKRVGVINITTMRQMGYASPDAAIGQAIGNTEIIGVVPDFPIPTRSTRDQTEAIALVSAATIGPVGSPTPGRLLVKIDGAHIGDAVRAIDAAWESLGPDRPLVRTFLDRHFQSFYLDLTRQTEAFNAFSLTSVFIACLGLFGLSAHRAESRTKEIGIRKSMGATRADILRLLLWQFTKPVLWANLIAWPAAYFIMRRWLEGFAYRIDLAPWMFMSATAAALAIALLTVIGHALLVARAHPVSALRYE